jgi:hypothetical protein
MPLDDIGAADTSNAEGAAGSARSSESGADRKRGLPESGAKRERGSSLHTTTRAAPSTRVELDAEVTPWSDTHFYAGLAGDVAGLCVVTYERLRPGDTVLLRIHLLEEVIELQGTARWSRAASENVPPAVGVGFGELPPRARAAIDAFCTQRAPLYYDVEDEAREAERSGPSLSSGSSRASLERDEAREAERSGPSLSYASARASIERDEVA